MKSVNGLVAHWRRVHHIYSDTAWLCISLPRTMSSHLSSLRVAISLTYSTGFVLLQGVVQDVCMHESLCRDWILSSKWPVGDPTWTRRSAYIKRRRCCCRSQLIDVAPERYSVSLLERSCPGPALGRNVQLVVCWPQWRHIGLIASSPR
jgi:hypothetical protein